jgi:membrane-bound lytic murein transglycosylase MltF
MRRRSLLRVCRAHAGRASRSDARRRRWCGCGRARSRYGDLDAILKRRRFRLIVPLSKTQFFIDRGHEMGAAAEFGREFEAWLNRRHARGRRLPITVVFEPTPRGPAAAGAAGRAGRRGVGRPDDHAGAAAAGGFRRALAERGGRDPGHRAGGAGGARPRRSRRARTLHVRPSSSYARHVARIGAEMAARGLAPLRVVALPERLQDEDVLHMVHAGLLPWAVVDDHLATVWSRLLRRLAAARGHRLDQAGDIAWAIRPSSPLLAAELAAFFETHRDRTDFGASIHERYFVSGRCVARAGAERTGRASRA